MTTVTGTAHECSFPIQPPEGSFFSPGPCQGCGKTFARSQAERKLREALAAMDETEPPGGATPWHETTGEFRRELMESHGDWRAGADRYRACARAENAAPIASAAHTACLMAASYGYALAAVLGAAERELGAAAAKRLTYIAATVITDGDDGGLNADVMPSADNPQAQPFERTRT